MTISKTYRPVRYGDPAIGIEYNKINTGMLVSRKLWRVDIARTPNVIRTNGNVNVHARALLANGQSLMTNYQAPRVRGMGRF